MSNSKMSMQTRQAVV